VTIKARSLHSSQQEKKQIEVRLPPARGRLAARMATGGDLAPLLLLLALVEAALVSLVWRLRAPSRRRRSVRFAEVCAHRGGARRRA
jgi:hypothetical protein